MPTACPGIKVENPCELVVSMYLCKEALKDEKLRSFWDPVFNYNTDRLDRGDYDGGIGSYKFTRELLMDYLERGENGAHSRELAAMNFGLGSFAVAFELEARYHHLFCIPRNDGRYLFTGLICSRQTVLMTLSIRARPFGFLLLVSFGRARRHVTGRFEGWCGAGLQCLA